MKCDLVIVGGGPAGLAAAIHGARRGFSVVVLERSVREKPCGEGLMPSGIDELTLLGARPEGAAFHGIRYVLEDGTQLDGRFARGQGLGVRRRALSSSLRALADEAGVRRIRAVARELVLREDGIRIDDVEARFCIGADGLGSFVRRSAGLEDGTNPIRRFGLRAHFPRAPRCDLVEVHWSDGAEAYVTPVGAREVNVAFLWEPARVPLKSWEELLARFPGLSNWLGALLPDGPPAGAGPLARQARAVAEGRVALVGDAAGYVDAITGQGISLALRSARLLVEGLPQRLDGAELPAALLRYRRAFRANYRSYALPAAALLALARKPRLRRSALRILKRWPAAFSRIVGAVAHAV